MDFGLSEEQRLLESTLRRFLGESAPTARVRELMDTPTACADDLWKGIAELGVAGILVPEAHGGAGLGMLDAVLAAESLGWAATPAPFLGTSVLAAVAFREGATHEQQREWLPQIAQGTTRIGVALGEWVARRDEAGLQVEGKSLTGTALFVVDTPGAEAVLVALRSGDLALVDARAPGLEVEELRTVDRTRRVGELRFHAVEVAEWIGGPGGAKAAIERMLDAGRLALAGDLLGSSERALELAVAYAKQRRQFGRVIGSFQAVKHLCAEMAAELEPARSLLWYAAHAFDALPEESTRMALHAKQHLSEVATWIVRTATEVHGGIGFTADCDLHLWFKRVALDRQLLGEPSRLRAELARRQGWGSG